MTTFTYRVKDKAGKTMDGSLETEDRRVAVARLQEMGYYVLDVQETRRRSESVNPLNLLIRYFFNPLLGGSSTSQLMLFYRQFATMLRAGMSLSQAMTSLRTQGGSRVLRRVASETLVFVNNGGKLSDSFAKYPHVFPELHVALIRAAEAGGNLESMVARIADYLERENGVRMRLRISTAYPKVLLLAVIFIPNLRILIFDGFNAYWHKTSGLLFPILAAVTILWAAHRLLVQIPQVKYALDMLKLAVPKLGKTVRMLALSKFYRVLGAMYASGSPLSRGLIHAANASANGYVASRLRRAAPMIDQGRSLSESLRSTQILPGMALDMLATGEQTGNIDQMLEKAAEYTEADADVAIMQGTMLVGVFLVLAVALYIGWFALQFYLGQYNNVTDFKG